MTRRHYADTAPTLTITGSITSSATSCVVTPAPVGWPASFPFFATLELGTANVEDVLVTNVVGSTLTITRGQNGTTAVAHGSGASIDHTYTATDMDEANAHVNATSGVHGIAGSVVGTTDVQTLTNKTLSGPTVTGTLAVTNETVSGTLSVTGTTTLGTVNTGAATATSVTSTGAVSAASLSVSGTSTFTGATTHNGALHAAGAGTGLDVTNNATVGGTLGVTGAASVGSLNVGGNAVNAGTWPSDTPQLAASTTSPTLGSGSIQQGNHVVIGKTVIGWGVIVFGSSGANAGSGTYTVSLPLPPASSAPFLGSFRVKCAGAYTRGELVYNNSTTAVLGYLSASVNGTLAFATNAAPGAWTNGDEVRYNYVYQTT